VLLVFICLGFIYLAVGPSGREKVKIALVVLVVLFLFAKDRHPSAPPPPSLAIGSCAPGFDCSADGKPLPPVSAALYDERGRPNSHGKVLILPKVMPSHPH
jgi:hypothetical protein